MFLRDCFTDCASVLIIATGAHYTMCHFGKKNKINFDCSRKCAILNTTESYYSVVLE